MGGDYIPYKVATGVKISIHTTRVGGDGTDGRVALVVEEFQSTPPVWVVTN